MTADRHDYLSLYQRRAVVLADEAVLAAPGQEFIVQLRDQAVAGLRSRTAAGGMVDAAGVVLSEKMPQDPAATGPDGNELSNRVILIHPRP